MTSNQIFAILSVNLIEPYLNIGRELPEKQLKEEQNTLPWAEFVGDVSLLSPNRLPLISCCCFCHPEAVFDELGWVSYRLLVGGLRRMSNTSFAISCLRNFVYQTSRSADQSSSSLTETATVGVVGVAVS